MWKILIPRAVMNFRQVYTLRKDELLQLIYVYSKAFYAIKIRRCWHQMSDTLDKMTSAANLNPENPPPVRRWAASPTPAPEPPPPSGANQLATQSIRYFAAFLII